MARRGTRFCIRTTKPVEVVSPATLPSALTRATQRKEAVVRIAPTPMRSGRYFPSTLTLRTIPYFGCPPGRTQTISSVGVAYR